MATQTKEFKMVVSKKDIMSFAWKEAKRAAKRHGGKASQYISMCLKRAWEMAKFLKQFPTVAAAEKKMNQLLGKYESTENFCLFFYCDSYRERKAYQHQCWMEDTPEWGGSILGGNIYAANFG